jgi:hypothetical protein
VNPSLNKFIFPLNKLYTYLRCLVFNNKLSVEQLKLLSIFKFAIPPEPIKTPLDAGVLAGIATDEPLKIAV